MLERVPAMILALCQNICFVRFFRRYEGSKVDAFLSRKVDPRLELIPGGGNAKKTGEVTRPRFSPVLSIFGVVRNAQVGNSVVAADGVNVVHDTVRVFPVNVKPSKAVSDMGQAINANGIVAFLIYHPSAVPSLCFSPSVYKPSEDARFWVVMQNLFQSSLRQCKSGFSHVIAPFQRWIGQRIEGVTSTFFPRSSIEGVA